MYITPISVYISMMCIELKLRVVHIRMTYVYIYTQHLYLHVYNTHICIHQHDVYTVEAACSTYPYDICIYLYSAFVYTCI